MRGMLRIEGLWASTDGRLVLEDVALTVGEGRLMALIGEDAAAGSTLLRCVNRLHEAESGGDCGGKVVLDHVDLLHDVDAVDARRMVGMVFSRPCLFPGMSVRRNVEVGSRLSGVVRRHASRELVERALYEAGVLKLVRDRLDRPADDLPAEVRQLIGLARALAAGPRMLLLDNPCAQLRGEGCARVERVMFSLRGRLTMLLLAQGTAQAARLADETAFLGAAPGRPATIIEAGGTESMFMAPTDPRTEAFITGRAGRVTALRGATRP
jgi:phosphate transport system ATP-binding protein